MRPLKGFPLIRQIKLKNRNRKMKLVEKNFPTDNDIGNQSFGESDFGAPNGFPFSQRDGKLNFSF
jgi:hypothetical protein